MATPDLTLDSPATSAQLSRHCSPGLVRTTLHRSNLTEFHLTLTPLQNESAHSIMRRLRAELDAAQAVVVRHEVFGSLAWHQQPSWDWPVTWVEGADCSGKPIAGMHVLAVRGADVDSIVINGQSVGRVFSDGYARHALLGNVHSDPQATLDVQGRQVFERLESALQVAGFAMTDVPRTWLFLDDILAWYGTLNRVRREFFEQRGLFNHLVPASTGVGVRNPAQAAMIAGAWASQPLSDEFFLGEVLSPMQCPAPAYGSCFSRAVEMVDPHLRRVLVSGTASIEPKGASVCGGDMDGQIDLTMQVVRAILVSRGMDYHDVTRATAYIRHPADAPLFQEWCQRLGLQDWPLVVTQAVVCRDELWFEIELDAIAPTHHHATDWEL